MNGKLAVVKRLRAAFGLGLLEAKRIADGDWKLADYVNVETFSDDGMAMVPYDRLRALEAREHETAERERTVEYNLDEYYAARYQAEKALRAERRAIRKAAMADDVLRGVQSRIMGHRV